LHGPHQVAQKSTRTGTVRDASTTSFMKVYCVASTIMLAAAGPAAPVAGSVWPMMWSMGSVPGPSVWVDLLDVLGRVRGKRLLRVRGTMPGRAAGVQSRRRVVARGGGLLAIGDEAA